jgi:hypothetical protein
MCFTYNREVYILLKGQFTMMALHETIRVCMQNYVSGCLKSFRQNLGLNK